MADVLFRFDVDAPPQHVFDTLKTTVGIKGFWTSRATVPTEVGERLGISPRTAKAHADVLRQKLGVARRRQIPAAYRELTGDDPLSPSLEPISFVLGG